MKLKTLFTAIATACTLATSASVQAQEVTLDSTAAIVNQEIILNSDLNKATQKFLDQYKAHGMKVDEIDVRRQALENLITRSLILQLAKNQGSELTDMELDKTIEQTALINNTSKETLLGSYGKNLTSAQAREKFKEDYVINEIRRSSIRQKIHISQSEINSLAKQLKEKGNTVEPYYNIAQITVPLSSTANEHEYERAQRNARAAISMLRSGAAPEEVSAKYGSVNDNVNMGFVPETSLPLPFVPGLVKAKPGDVIGPFRSQVGFHIVKLIDVTKNAMAPIVTYDAAHILIKTSIIYSDEAAVAKLQGIKHDITSGNISFADAAKQYSEDPGSAINGGDLGYALPDRYDPGFARGMMELTPGQISEPVKSSYGWHLIYLKDKKVDTDSMEVYKDKAYSILFEREYNEAVLNWERNLRETSYIRVLDPALLNAGVKLDQEKPKF